MTSDLQKYHLSQTMVSSNWYIGRLRIPWIDSSTNYSTHLSPGVSFTKLGHASYNQVIHCRSHELILVNNYYIALGYVACTLPYIAPHYAATCVGSREPNERTWRSNIFVKDPQVPSFMPIFCLLQLQTKLHTKWKSQIHIHFAFSCNIIYFLFKSVTF